MAKLRKRYAMLVDLDRCIGCFSCQVTCKAEHNTPFGTFRCRVETYSSGTYPELKKTFMPRTCNQCENPSCINACEQNALYKNQDGVIILDPDKCIGCGKCHEKCPYNAIDRNDSTGRSEKCDFCYTRLTAGELPACVQGCMGKALTFGDIKDPKSGIYAKLHKHSLYVLKPEAGTNPSIFFISRLNLDITPLKGYELPKQFSSRNITETDTTKQKERNIKIVHTSDVMCPSECGINVVVEDGRAKKIYGNPHSLLNNGTMCAKGASGLQLTYSPHRIKTPLMRTGDRGEDRWKEISWEEAADHIAEKLVDIKQRHGAESVFLDCGDVTDREAYYRLFHAFGTPNTCDHGSICDPNRKWGPHMIMGDERPLPDIQRPILIRNDDEELHHRTKHDIKLLLNIGLNPLVATRFNYMSRGIPAARQENECIYIVVDPAHTNSAAKADMWFPIKPGTDTELLAAILYYIIMTDSSKNESKMYIDHDFIEKYTIGWQKFKDDFLAYTLKKDPANDLEYFTLDWASEKTGISKDNIEKMAHMFGITKPAAIEIGMHGTAHHTNGDIASILMTALCVITGNIDVPGGLVFINSQKAVKGRITIGKDFLSRPVERKVNDNDVNGSLFELDKDLFGDHPAAWKKVLTDLPSAIRNGVNLKHGPFKGHGYPVKAFVTRAGNPVMTAGSTPDWTDALTSRDENNEYRLELMVFIDTHITMTGKYADIILPEAGYLERMGVSDVYTMSPEIAIRDQVIKPLHASKTPFEIMITLSDALIKHNDPDIRPEDFSSNYKDEESFINEILSEAPGFYNIGLPVPYPKLPEGCLISGTPDDPSVIWGKKTIKEGTPLTVEWLRNNNGVAVWPASYYRYKKHDGSPSGSYPKTASRKFEFRFGYLEKINDEKDTAFPISFYWDSSKWNRTNTSFRKFSEEYPFQLISGRVHHSMTMTSVCPYLAETDTECMKPLNDEFSYSMPQETADEYSISGERIFKANSVSIPVFAINKVDGKKLDISSGDIISIENPLKKHIRGKAFLTEDVMPGVIKVPFGPAGQKTGGIGFTDKTSSYAPNINELHDPENYTALTGCPGFGDIMVKIIKNPAVEQ